MTRILGSGSFGYVFEANDIKNNRKIAWKRVEKVGNKVSREYEILYQVRKSDYVIKVLDFFYSRTDSNKLIQNIIFEYIEDNLENKL